MSQSHRFKRRALTTAISVVSACAGLQSFAQDGEERLDNSMLEETIVTGTFRREGSNPIQESISVSSIDVDAIQNQAPATVADLYRNIPGIRAESSAGGGNTNIVIRGIPLSTGGAKFLQQHEDGLPVLMFGDLLFAPADSFLKPDASVARVESVRGGTASVLTTNGGGGIINIINQTGEDEGGTVSLRYGVNYDDLRMDFSNGGRISDDVYYHVGGHLQYGNDIKDSGFNRTEGGQVRFSLTKEFEDGFFRINTKRIDRTDPLYFAGPTSRSESDTGLRGDGNGDVGTIGTSSPYLDIANEDLSSQYTRFSTAVDSEGNVVRTDLADGLQVEVNAVGTHFEFTTDNGITVENKNRYQQISGEFNGLFLNDFTVVEGEANTDNLFFYNGPNAGGAVTESSLRAASGSNVLGNTVVFAVDFDNLSNFTNELKVSKSFDFEGTSLDVVVGHFYMNQEFEQDWHWSSIIQTLESESVLVNDPTRGTNGTFGVNQGFWPGNNRQYDLEATVDAPFIAGSLNVLDDSLRLDLAVRRETMEQNGVRLEANGAPFDVNNDGTISAGEATVSLNNGTIGAQTNFDVSHTDWSFGANYLINDSFATFIRYSEDATFNFDRALDFGAREVDGTLNGAGENLYVDNLDQLEVGLKYQGDDLQVYATFFQTDLEEANGAGVLSGASGGGVVLEYESTGLEVEAAYSVGDFNISGSVTWTDAEVASGASVDAVTGAQTSLPGLNGNVPARQADFIYNLNASYDLGPVLLGGSLFGTDDSYASIQNRITQPGYEVVNLYAKWYMSDDLGLTFTVNNVFDEVGITESAVQDTPNTRPGTDTNGDGARDTVIARSIAGRLASLTLTYQF